MARKEALKGRIQEAKERLAEVEEEINRHYSKAKELQAEAYQLRENHQGDVTKLKQANDLDEMAKNHLECADRLRSEERFIATRELHEVLEKARFVRADVSKFSVVIERYNADKEQLKQELKRKIEDIDSELENAAWQLEQAERLLSELEGGN